MLNAEELKKKLETFRSDKFIDQRLSRLAGLPKALHSDARALLRLEKLPDDEESERYWIKEQKRSQKAAAASGFGAGAGSSTAAQRGQSQSADPLQLQDIVRIHPYIAAVWIAAADV